MININKTPLPVQRNLFLRKETSATSCLQTSWVHSDLLVSFWCLSCRLGACSERRLISGMGYPLLEIPWRWLLSHFCAATVSRHPLSWKPEEQPSLHVSYKLFFWIIPKGRSGVTLVRVVWTSQDVEDLDHKATRLGLHVPTSELKSGIGATPSWQNTLLNADLWLQPRKHFEDVSAFTVSSEDSRKERTVLLLSWKKNLWLYEYFEVILLNSSLLRNLSLSTQISSFSVLCFCLSFWIFPWRYWRTLLLISLGIVIPAMMDCGSHSPELNASNPTIKPQRLFNEYSERSLGCS